MGFYIRKALTVGPLRFNLSKSGVGVSAGIRGLRLGSGPRGNYVHMGRGGLYFRKSLDTPPGRSSHVPAGRPRTASPGGPVEAHGTVAPMADIDSGSVLQMTDASSAELLRELNQKRKLVSLLPGAIGLTVFLVLIAGASGGPPGLLAFIIASGLGLCWLASMKDDLRKTTVVFYELEPEVEKRYEELHSAFEQLCSCARIWHIEARGEVRDRKYHAGASSLIRRRHVAIRKGTPLQVKTNIEVPLVPVGRQTLAFLPDRLLVFEPGAVGAVRYDALVLDVSPTRFIEEESVPGDATVVGHTWRYVNKKGGPDRRFKDNRELPICAYESLHFSSSSGLNELLHVSRRNTGSALVSALAGMRELGQERALSMG